MSKKENNGTLHWHQKTHQKKEFADYDGQETSPYKIKKGKQPREIAFDDGDSKSTWKKKKGQQKKDFTEEEDDEDNHLSDIQEDNEDGLIPYGITDPNADDPNPIKNQMKYMRRHIGADVLLWQVPYWQSLTSSLYFSSLSKNLKQKDINYSEIYYKAIDEYKEYYLDSQSLNYDLQPIGYIKYGNQKYTFQVKLEILQGLDSSKMFSNGREIIKIIETADLEMDDLPDEKSMKTFPKKNLGKTNKQKKKSNFFQIFKSINDKIAQQNQKQYDAETQESDYDLDIFASALFYTFLTKYTYFQQILKTNKCINNPISYLRDWFYFFKNKNPQYIFYTQDPGYYNRKELKDFRKKVAVYNQTDPKFIEHIENGNYEEVRKSLELGLNPDFSTPLRRLKSPLHLAVVKGDLKLIDQLLRYGADINCVDTMGSTAIFYAIESNFHEVVKFLIEKGTYLEQRDLQNSTPQYMAVFCSDLKMIEILVSNGAQPSVLNFLGRSPLIKAAYLGKYDMLDYLLEKDKSLIDHKDERGRTPTMAACWGIKGGRKGKKLNGKDIGDSPESLRVQIKHGSDIDIIDNDGNKAVHISCSTCGLETQKIWYESYGQEILKTRNEHGQDCIGIICEYGHYEILNYQIDTCKLSPISFKTSTNEFMLYTALLNKNFKIVSYQFKTILDQENLAGQIIKDNPEIPSDFLRVLRQKIFKRKASGWHRYIKRDWIQDCIYTAKLWELYNQIKDDPKSFDEIFLFMVDCIRYQAIPILDYLITWISPEVIRGYITDNFDRIIGILYNDTECNLFGNFETLQMLFDKFVTDEKQLNFRDKRNRNIISQCVLNGNNESILYQLKKLMPVELEEKLLQQRIKSLLVKDSDGQTFIEYGIINRKVIVSEYLKKMNTNEKIPEIKILGFEIEKKSEEVLASEESHIKTLVNKLEKVENLQEEAFDCCTTKDHMQKSLEIVENLKSYDKSANFSLENLSNANYKKIEYINNETELKRVVDELSRELIIGIDLEFSSGKFTGVLQDIKDDKNQTHLKESILACSVQISSLTKNYFIDCLEMPRLIRKHLKTLFENISIQKVLHGSDNDIKVLYENYGIILSNVFDTSKCWSILNKSKQMPGLNKLTLEAFGIRLDKTLQCAEWRIRPLPTAMLNYAICDSFLMIPLFYYFLEQVDLGYIQRKGHLKTKRELFDKTFVRSNGFVKLIQITKEIFIEC